MYKVKIEKQCFKELKKLSKNTVKHAFDLIEGIIAKNPYSGKGLKGKYKGLFSYRFSEYRIIYQIKQKQVEILILRIRHRKDVYDGL